MKHASRVLSVIVLALCAATPQISAFAQPAAGTSGLPVPRFVSLKTDKVVVRMGPNKNHEVKWLYQIGRAHV